MALKTHLSNLENFKPVNNMFLNLKMRICNAIQHCPGCFHYNTAFKKKTCNLTAGLTNYAS